MSDIWFISINLWNWKNQKCRSHKFLSCFQVVFSFLFYLFFYYFYEVIHFSLLPPSPSSTFSYDPHGSLDHFICFKNVGRLQWRAHPILVLTHPGIEGKVTLQKSRTNWSMSLSTGKEASVSQICMRYYSKGEEKHIQNGLKHHWQQEYNLENGDCLGEMCSTGQGNWAELLRNCSISFFHLSSNARSLNVRQPHWCHAVNRDFLFSKYSAVSPLKQVLQRA